MRNILGIDSYMDQVLPHEIEVFIYNEIEIRLKTIDEIKDAIMQFEKYCIQKKKTLLWSVNKFPVFDLISDSKKKNMSFNELVEYYFDLKEYYFETVDNKSIKRLSNKKEEKLSDYDYLLYLKQLRLYDEESKLNNLDLEERIKINPYLRKVMKASRILSGIKVNVLNKDIPEEIKNRKIIYVVTHVGRDDQIVFSEQIMGHYTVLSGDYESLHNNLAGLISIANGIIAFDMRSKKERKEVNDRVIEKLNSGDNILCSMEGVWNLSPNKLVLDLFPGMIEIARKSNAIILPVGIERFDSKHFGLNVSKEYFDAYDFFEKNSNLDEKELMNQSITVIRNLLAQAKFELYFDEKIKKKITTKRNNIKNYEEYNKKFKNSILKGWTFDEEAIKEKSYKAKDNPYYVYQYLIKKYSTLKKELNYIRLSELVNDLKNEIYPNDIHNELLSIYNEICQKKLK